MKANLRSAPPAHSANDSCSSPRSGHGSSPPRPSQSAISLLQYVAVLASSDDLQSQGLYNKAAQKKRVAANYIAARLPSYRPQKYDLYGKPNAALYADQQAYKTLIQQVKGLRQNAAHLESLTTPTKPLASVKPVSGRSAAPGIDRRLVPQPAPTPVSLPPPAAGSLTGADKAGAPTPPAGPTAPQAAPMVTFADVVGLEEAKQGIRDGVITPRKWPQTYGERGARPWKNILLHGPPGTGKTLLAQAAANEAGCYFIPITASDVTEKWFGSSEANVRAIFERARAHKPCIVFVDEIDSLLAARTSDGNEASTRIKTTFFTEMEGFNSDKDVMVMAATNQIGLLDVAILRRFDVRVEVGLPTVDDRVEIFRKQLACIPATSPFTEEQLRIFAQATPDYSGSDLETVVRTAAMDARQPIFRAEYFKPSPQEDGYVVPAQKWDVGAFEVPKDPSQLRVKLDLHMNHILEAIQRKPPAARLANHK